jgi:hypothetical protein
VVEVAVGDKKLSIAREFPQLHSLVGHSLGIACNVGVYQEYVVTGLNLEPGRSQPLKFHAISSYQYLLPEAI